MTISPHAWPLLEGVLDEVEALCEEERVTALDRLCAGQPELRRTVERLLDAERACTSAGFLDETAAAVAAPLLVGPRRPAAPPPAHVGPYRVVREVGRGGYGTVYLAERDGVGLRVAVKVLRDGAGRAAQRRFQREQRMLAMLEHPNIPRLIDTGSTDGGAPYFAMEYVEGEPITAYADGHRLGLRDRLRLFLEAAEAIRYAHARLVVHRDLKPQNVLVGDGERGPVVKVVDFGIAKPFPPATDRVTGTGPFAPMTLAYAAPEQLQGAPADPASDVYALGLLLYVLVAGRLPYEIGGRSLRDVERVVSDGPVPRPSTVAAAPWSRRLRGDIDHVVLRALEKEPKRRYRSAEALHRDVERYLEGLPVSARRPSWTYAAWRFAWRRRGAVVAGALVVLAAAATYGFGLRRERAAALRAAEERAVVAEVLADVLSSTEAAPEGTTTADAILTLATEAIRTRLGPRPGIEAELLTIVGQQYATLGRWEEAIPLFERAVTLESRYRPNHPAYAVALVGLAGALIDRNPTPTSDDIRRSKALYRRAWRMHARQFGRHSPLAAGTLCLLGDVYYQEKNYTVTARLCSEAVADLEVALSDSMRWRGVFQAAHERIGYRLWHPSWYESTQSTRESLWSSLATLGNAEVALGHFQRATRSLQRAALGLREHFPNQRFTARTFEALGNAHLFAGYYSEADSAYSMSLSIFSFVYGPASASASRATGNVAIARFLSGNIVSAETIASEAISMAEQIPDSLEILAHSYTLAYILRRRGDLRGSLRFLDRVLDIAEHLHGIHPDVFIFEANAHAERSSAMLELGHREIAEREGRLAYGLASRITTANISGLAAAAYAEALMARGAYRPASAILESAYADLWAPPVRMNRRPLAVRITSDLVSAFTELRNDTLAAVYQEALTRHDRLYLSK